MLAEDDIKTLTYDVSPFVSEEEAKQEGEDIEIYGEEMDEEELIQRNMMKQEKRRTMILK